MRNRTSGGDSSCYSDYIGYGEHLRTWILWKVSEHMRSHEFMAFLREHLAYPFTIHQSFVTFDKEGRTFIIDTIDGDLYAHPTMPSKRTLDRIEREQCKRCFFASNVDAAKSCIKLVRLGFMKPVFVCVIHDVAAEKKMVQIQDANHDLFQDHLTPVQLKVMSLIIALHEYGLLPLDIQEKIDLIPTRDIFEKDGNCPAFCEIKETRIKLIEKNLSRYVRKRRFLDIMRDMQYLSPSHHAIGIVYYDRHIAALNRDLLLVQEKK